LHLEKITIESYQTGLLEYTVQMHFFRSIHNLTESLLGPKLFHLIRYLLSGGTAAAFNVGILFLLVQYGNFHYLQASIMAYLIAIAVSFTLQKFWTFQDKPIHDIRSQFFRYILIVFANLGLNTFIMYLFVTKFGVWYIFAQIMTTGLVAVTGYFGYKYFVFKERVNHAYVETTHT
jgi:putative flippase GtrA